MTKETTRERWVVHVARIYIILMLAGFVCASALVLSICHNGRMKHDLRDLQARQTELKESICRRVGHDWEFVRYNGPTCVPQWSFKCRSCGIRDGVYWSDDLTDSQRKAIRDKCGVEPPKAESKKDDTIRVGINTVPAEIQWITPDELSALVGECLKGSRDGIFRRLNALDKRVAFLETDAPLNGLQMGAELRQLAESIRDFDKRLTKVEGHQNSFGIGGIVIDPNIRFVW